MYLVFLYFSQFLWLHQEKKKRVEYHFILHTRGGYGMRKIKKNEEKQKNYA